MSLSAWRIPFNRAHMTGRELEYVREAFRNGHVSGDGPFTARCQEMLEEVTGAGRALLTTSGTHALEMSALLLDISPGDEVILPSFTFVSTVNAFVLRGAVPVFADIRTDTLNMDEELLPGLVTDRTAAIVPVHYAGISCEMDRIMEIAGENGIPVIEDAAHGLFGSYRGAGLGSIGTMGILSFHETKNVTCGEGGALLINDPSLIRRAEIIREKGTDRSRFLRGEVDRYTWVDLGSSYPPSEILAAFLQAQLEEADSIQSRRRNIWLRYMEELEEWATRVGVGLPVVPESCSQSWHIFHLVMPDEEARNSLISRLKELGILSVFHYQPLHLSDMGRSLGRGECPVTADIACRLVRLPLYYDLTPEEQTEVISAVVSG